jgi:hypothetical protein
MNEMKPKASSFRVTFCSNIYWTADNASSEVQLDLKQKNKTAEITFVSNSLHMETNLVNALILIALSSSGTLTTCPLNQKRYLIFLQFTLFILQFLCLSSKFSVVLLIIL